jgi:hypothetical protein
MAGQSQLRFGRAYVAMAALKPLLEETLEVSVMVTYRMARRKPPGLPDCGLGAGLAS